MTYEFKGNFTERKPGLVVCSFCHLLSVLYSEEGGKLDPKDEHLWRLHLQREHGWIADEELPA